MRDRFESYDNIRVNRLERRTEGKDGNDKSCCFMKCFQVIKGRTYLLVIKVICDKIKRI